MLSDSKIYLITYMEHGRELVSHGIGDFTLMTYILSQDPPSHFHPKRDFEGWYIDGPAAREVHVRVLVLSGKKWQEKKEAITARELDRLCWDLEGQYAVLVDDKKGVYYCGRSDLLEAYRAKGKVALPLVELERRLFHDITSFEIPT